MIHVKRISWPIFAHLALIGLVGSCFNASLPAEKAAPMVTERRLLKDGEPEGDYGLYSYVLFWASPSDELARARYEAIIDAYCSMIAESGTYRASRERINMTYLPVRTLANCRSRDLLPVYSYDRAKQLLTKLEGSYFAGPYIVTTESRLSGYSRRPNEFFMQDMSEFPPSVIRAYVRDFLEKAQTRDTLWENKTDFVLWARTRVEQLATSLPDAEIAAGKIKLALQFFRNGG